jgi:hypothetical protein
MHQPPRDDHVPLADLAPVEGGDEVQSDVTGDDDLAGM